MPKKKGLVLTKDQAHISKPVKVTNEMLMAKMEEVLAELRKQGV